MEEIDIKFKHVDVTVTRSYTVSKRKKGKKKMDDIFMLFWYPMVSYANNGISIHF